jgi:hypothetical protein
MRSGRRFALRERFDAGPEGLDPVTVWSYLSVIVNIAFACVVVGSCWAVRIRHDPRSPRAATTSSALTVMSLVPTRDFAPAKS